MTTTCQLCSWSGAWRDVRAACDATSGGATSNQEPSGRWKRRILLAEHSPIRLLSWTVEWSGLPYWVSGHIVRHKIGAEHWVRSQRQDRTGVSRSDLAQDEPVTHRMQANAQAIIAISRKRMCCRASPETRQAWQMALLLLPMEMQDACVPECVYRGFCPEMVSCEFHRTTEWKANRYSYIQMKEVLQ